MKVVKELELKHARQIRHTLVQGRDEQFYKIYTFQLYDMPPPPEFPNFEVSVNECDAAGAWSTLTQLFLQRFFKKQDATETHDRLLKEFDALFQLKAPEPKGHKKEEPAAH